MGFSHETVDTNKTHPSSKNAEGVQNILFASKT